MFTIGVSNALTMLSLNKNSDFIMFCAVAAALPGSTSDPAYMLKNPSGTSNRYKKPASLALYWGDMFSSTLLPPDLWNDCRRLIAGTFFSFIFPPPCVS
jgi:hypothetical protein